MAEFPINIAASYTQCVFFSDKVQHVTHCNGSIGHKYYGVQYVQAYCYVITAFHINVTACCTYLYNLLHNHSETSRQERYSYHCCDTKEGLQL